MAPKKDLVTSAPSKSGRQRTLTNKQQQLLAQKNEKEEAAKQRTLTEAIRSEQRIEEINGFHKTKLPELPLDDDNMGPESEDEPLTAFSSVTLPPIIKKVERNGRTLVYRVQESSVDQEVSSASAPNLKSQPVKSSKNLVRRVTGEGTSYPSMVVDVDDDIEEPLYPDANPARAKETKQKKTPEGKQLEKETHGTKRKESPTTTSTETTVVTKSIKLEGSGSRGRVRTADFNELARSIIEETISIYRAQIGGVDPFPERTDDRLCETRRVG